MISTIASIGLPKQNYQIELLNRNRSHWYNVSDLSGNLIGCYQGVTTFLNVISKPALVPWATKEALKMTEAALMNRLGGKSFAEVHLTPEWISSIIAEARARPDKLKTEAADLGTLAHQVFDRIVKGEEIRIDDVPEIIRHPVSNFIGWLKQSGIQLIMGDTKVASIHESFGGSLDALGWIDGVGYVILDWKTSNGIYTEYALQVAAYATAFEETFDKPITEAYIIRFDKKIPEWDAKKDLRKLSNLTVSYGAFKAAKELKTLLDEQHYDN